MSSRVTSLLRLLVAVVLLSCTNGVRAESRFVRNGSLNQRGSLLKDSEIQKLRADGWTCPDAKDWPIWWGGIGANVKVEIPTTGGKDNDSFFRISGKDGIIVGYHGLKLEDRNYVLTVWARGKGVLRMGVLAYGLSEDGKNARQITAPPHLDVKVDSEKWVRYRHVILKSQELFNVHALFCALEGTVDFDEVDIEPLEPGQELMVREEEQLYATGALIENLDLVAADDVFKTKAEEYAAAIQAFRKKADGLDPALVKSLEQEIATLAPYVLSKGLSSVQAARYNDMLALTRILKRLAGESVGERDNLRPSEAVQAAIDHEPGVRKPRPDGVTITDVHSNKVRYDENETATTRATLMNTSGRAYSGTLTALMHLDLDMNRELARTPMRVGGLETKTWSFSYNVGPETYGRGIEVRFEDESGRVLDSFQEFYAVAAEWFRVHQHTHNVSNKLYEVTPWVSYFNQSHFFASEPTDFGVHSHDAELYISGQAGYHINPAARKAQIQHYRDMGVRHTFYQTGAFCGQMGYEEMRRRPEFALYDANGQPAVDPIYGGYPNPMELASPLEIGAKRKVEKPYLDRRYTPWQHCCANLANEDIVVYEAERIKQYAKEHGFDGIYVDGNMGVNRGYAHDGRSNVPSGKEEDIARLSARNHRVFSEILKKDNPNFGTWFNWGFHGLDWARSVGLTCMFGSGAPGDVGDENIKAATGWKNVMILMETGSFLQAKEGWTSVPADFLKMLIEQRDHAVQRNGANSIIGYSFIPWKEDEPGPAKWAWPTMNYVGAQLIATQTHHAGGFLPSFRPTLQFQTRYSSLLWSRDIKTLPNEEKVVAVSSSEPVWCKRLVYRRENKEGYDLIVHLVRIPPTKRWDYQWVDEPTPLKGVKVTVNLQVSRLRQVQAMRPYHFEEEQQPVQSILKPVATGGRAAVEVPPFRYHAMVVFRVASPAPGAQRKRQ